MNTHLKNHAQRIKRLIRIPILMLLILWVYMPSPVQAASPKIVIGLVGDNGCVVDVTLPIDVDTVTRDSLPQEVSASWPVEALKANAVLIRTFARHFAYNPESNDSTLCGSDEFFFHMRMTRI